MDCKLTEAKVALVEHIRNIQLLLIAAQHAVTLNVACHTVDNMRHRNARVGVVRILVLDRSLVDRAVDAKGEQTLVPVDVAGEVSVNAVLEEQALERGAQVFLVGCCFGAVHWPVAHGEDPRSFLAVDAGEIFGEPLVLLVGLVVFVATGHCAEGAAVGDESFACGGKGLVAFDIVGERFLWAVGEVGFAVEGDEVCEAVVEGVPEVADSAGLLAGHAEAVLVGGEVSVTELAMRKNNLCT